MSNNSFLDKVFSEVERKAQKEAMLDSEKRKQYRKKIQKQRYKEYINKLFENTIYKNKNKLNIK